MSNVSHNTRFYSIAPPFESHIATLSGALVSTSYQANLELTKVISSYLFIIHIKYIQYNSCDFTHLLDVMIICLGFLLCNPIPTVLYNTRVEHAKKITSAKRLIKIDSQRWAQRRRHRRRRRAMISGDWRCRIIPNPSLPSIYNRKSSSSASAYTSAIDYGVLSISEDTLVPFVACMLVNSTYSQ